MEVKSALEMARGAILERVDYEMKIVLDNILDENTRADKKRTIVVTLDILPDMDRRNLQMSARAKSKLEPTNPVQIALYVTHDENGEFAVVELTPQVPGQIDMTGGEQEPPVQLRII